MRQVYVRLSRSWQHRAGCAALTICFVVGTDLSCSVFAAPVVDYYIHNTLRFGPHQLPDLPAGDWVQLFAGITSIDPVASPTISVAATQSDTTLILDAVPSAGIFTGHGYYKFLPPDPELMGPWQITPTDSTGTGPTTFTNAIVEAEFLPLITAIAIAGTPTNTSIQWALPDMSGYDVELAAVRLYEIATGTAVFQSDTLSGATTNYQPPVGTLLSGVEYVYCIILGDMEGNDLENASFSFSAPFRLTIVGDYNQDGIVNAADYSVWRDNVGGTHLVNRGAGIIGPVGAEDYQVWKTNFGQSFGIGSDTTPAIPEPSAAILVLPALVCSLANPRRAYRGQ